MPYLDFIASRFLLMLPRLGSTDMTFRRPQCRSKYLSGSTIPQKITATGPVNKDKMITPEGKLCAQNIQPNARQQAAINRKQRAQIDGSIGWAGDVTFGVSAFFVSWFQ
mmetsp:Transcript_46763/g.109072  ORF Transcript_46763/g.109072 Transcript_46763/m.109072 type:complete len:109 (+) Transcript_46763:2416-2742(+)